ncbi:PAS domain S-box protein [bacterium]|nr:PAS domain S-box protein [bacterium]
MVLKSFFNQFKTDDSCENKCYNDIQSPDVLIELVQICNSAMTIDELLKTVCVFLKKWSGFEAIGIRYQADEEYPYFVNDGFSEDFIKSENNICLRDDSDQILHDKIGNPILDCICGKVLCGNFDPGLPFFSKNGSFWTNSTTNLLSSTRDEDLPNTRNQCIDRGYETLALFPLQHASKIYGLLQFNDSKPDCITSSLVSFVEKMALTIGSSIAHLLSINALNKIEKKHFEFLNLYGTIFLSRDFNGTVTFINKVGCELLGYPEEEIIGKKWLDFLPKSSHFTSSKIFNDMISGIRNTNFFEIPVLTASGEKRIINWNIKTVRDENNNIIGTLSSGNDITEQAIFKQEKNIVIKKLLESQDNYHQLFENASVPLIEEDMFEVKKFINSCNLFKSDSPEVVFEKHPELLEKCARLVIIKSINKQALKLYEACDIESFKDGLVQLLDDENMEIFKNVLIRFINKESYYHFETTNKTFSGNTLNVDIVWHYSPTIESPWRYLVSIRNITKRIKMEKALRKSEERYRVLFETSMDAILIFNQSGVIEDCNLATCKLLANSKDKIIGTPIVNYITSVQSKLFNNLFNNFKEKEQIKFEISMTTHDNKIIDVDVNAHWLFDNHNIGQAVFRNITKRKLAELSLIDYQSQLSKLNESLISSENQLRRNISIEIHDDISQLLVACSMKIKSLPMITDENRVRLDDIVENLDIAIQRARDLTVKISPPVIYELGLGQGIKWLCNDYSQKFDVKISYTVDVPDLCLEKEIEVFLFRCTNEFLFNIVKHASASHVQLQMNYENEILMIEVFDNGKGFLVDQRLKECAAEQCFGLFSIRDRISRNGGEFHIESSRKKGTHVWLMYPVLNQRK